MIQRTVDIVLSLVLLAVLMPLLAACTLTVLFAHGRPAIFVQQRIGRGGHAFRLLKIRSMRPDPAGSAVTASGDSRITGFGRFMRRFKLDELPQLVNVLRGDMSFVGHRPEVFAFEAVVRRPEYAALLERRPGVVSRVTLDLADEELLIAAELARRAAAGEATSVDTLYRDWLLPKKLAREVTDAARYVPVWSELRLGFATVLRMLGFGKKRSPEL